MDIPVDLGTIFDENCVRLDSQSFKKFNIRKYPFVANMIDKMGKLSADAQKMRRVLTAYDKLLESSDDQILYLLWEPQFQNPSHSSVVGFLKVGRRNLYLYDKGKTSCHQRRPISILDFYVHFTRQRQGNGKILYDAMLKGEHILPQMVAIDKPSDSLLAFLAKHYHLTNPVWQNTHYVVFPGFFESPDQLPDSDDNHSTLNSSFGKLDNGDHELKSVSQTNSPIKNFTPISVPDMEQPNRISPMKPLVAEASPPASPNSGSTSVTVPFGALSVVSPNKSNSTMAKESKIKSLGHSKLW